MCNANERRDAFIVIWTLFPTFLYYKIYEIKWARVLPLFLLSFWNICLNINKRKMYELKNESSTLVNSMQLFLLWAKISCSNVCCDKIANFSYLLCVKHCHEGFIFAYSLVVDFTSRMWNTVWRFSICQYAYSHRVAQQSKAFSFTYEIKNVWWVHTFPS